MKKKSILNLIKYHVEKNDAGFKHEAYEIAKEFDEIGDYQLAEYITSLLSGKNNFVPQSLELDTAFLEKVALNQAPLLLPESIMRSIFGIVNAVSHNLGINKFLFQGPPGTGKTEAVKQLARILDREVYMVDFTTLVDSRLGQTQKNLGMLFKAINSFPVAERIIILFDEIDALALDRTNPNDLREMGRATTALLKGMDNIDGRVVMIATTNLYEHFDKALIRRFDNVVNFNQYSRDDLVQVAEKIMDDCLSKFKIGSRDVRLFKKIINLYEVIPYPGDLKNIIKTAVAFSNSADSADYLRNLYYAVCEEKPNDLSKLQSQKFTVREIEVLAQKPKSTVARELKEV